MIKVEKNGKHVVVAFGPDGCDMFATAPVKITLAEDEARDLVEKLGACGAKAKITPAAVAAAEKVLADNGIDGDDAAAVLQAISYALAGIGLYPANYAERRFEETNMRRNPKFDVKIKLAGERGTSQKPLWLHVEWFNVGGANPRKYVDQYWLTEDRSEATPVEPLHARRLAAEARDMALFNGDGVRKAVYMAKAGRKWVPTTLKKALAAEEASRAKSRG